MTNGAIKIDPTSMNQVGFILANSTFGNVYANLGQVVIYYVHTTTVLLLGDVSQEHCVSNIDSVSTEISHVLLKLIILNDYMWLTSILPVR